jgi:hypothetical protein
VQRCLDAFNAEDTAGFLDVWDPECEFFSALYLESEYSRKTSWPCGQDSHLKPECPRRRNLRHRREGWATGFDCGPVPYS